MLRSVLETGGPAKAKQQELGIPDLSLTTIRQMATELKRRENLCFAVVWIEDNEEITLPSKGAAIRLNWSDYCLVDCT
jgi:hypothetical protein